MSNSSRKSHLKKKHVESSENTIKAQSPKQSRKALLLIAIVAILAGVPFLLGKYIEFNSPNAFDGGCYEYSAKHILDGAEIGVEEIPSAQIGTLLLNILGVRLFGFSDVGPEVIQMLLQAGALVLMFISMRKLFGDLAAAVGVIVASIYLSSPVIAKYGNVKEQFMIAFMVLGISCFIMRQLDGKWWWGVLAGAFASCGPLFKETGTTALGAMALFVVVQPFLKHRTWKQTFVDIGLLVLGFAAAIGPIYVWILGWGVKMGLPYAFVWRIVGSVILPAEAGGSAVGSYVSGSRSVIPFSVQWPRVLRFYGVLILPISLAVGAVIARFGRMVAKVFGSKAGSPKNFESKRYDRFVLLLAVWWLLDMGFVWVSPRSYEQYYLPLNASAAMLGGYLIALYWDRLSTAVFKTKWIVVGMVGVGLMVFMSWHIFFGISKSPHSGTKYRAKRRGYSQKLEQVSRRRKSDLKAPWEIVGEYIKERSTPEDKIYVWGWVPGIYVKAQRLSSTIWPFESEMHTRNPEVFAERIRQMVSELEKDMPKFIVDSRKNHMPMDRPPHELWPVAPKKLTRANKDSFVRSLAELDLYETWHVNDLRNRFGDEEAARYQAVRPLQEFIMKNYKIVGVFGRQQVLFELKNK